MGPKLERIKTKFGLVAENRILCCRPVMPNQPYDWEKSGEMEREKTVIRVSGLKKYYTVGGATVRALDGVDLQVGAGEFLCISGRSGSGKSTMLSMLAGLDNPTAGSIEILGTHLERQSEEQRSQFRRKNIGFVFQNYNLMPQYTTLENVALPLAIRGVPEKKRNQAARWILSKVGLAEHVQHKPSELSGGQQQRAGIARAIITKLPSFWRTNLRGIWTPELVRRSWNCCAASFGIGGPHS